MKFYKQWGSKSVYRGIFLTVYSDESFIKEASRLGAVGYIIEPVTEEQLIALHYTHISLLTIDEDRVNILYLSRKVHKD